MTTKSVKVRFLVSLCSNALRAAMSFLTGLIIAKALSPAGYGQLTFLLGSFVSIRTLLDMGASNAFYTFISQDRRPLRYYSYYALWLVFQFVITASAVGFLMPDVLVDRIWVGHGRGIVLLAFAASFIQQQIWLTINQMGEASRKTVRVQVLNVSAAAVYLSGAALLSVHGALSVQAVLILIIIQYLAFSLAAYWVLRPPHGSIEPVSGETITFSEMFGKYKAYCMPLVMLSVIGFIYDFADKWMLQRFGGANQQGFYQVAFQFAAISILATTSVINIFWKEIAEAVKLKNSERVASIFRKASRGLYMFGAILSGFLIPWSRQIIEVFLGDVYASAGPVLGLMLIYPLHQSLGQIAGTMLLAGERTKQFMAVSAVGMLVSLPISYFIQAPAAGVFMPGLGLGAVGMAVKMVCLNIITVNVTLWVIARSHGWKWDYLYQIVGLASMSLLGFACRSGAGLIFRMDTSDSLRLLPPFLLSGIVYLMCAGMLIWSMPWLIGMNREEIRTHAVKTCSLIFKERYKTA